MFAHSITGASEELWEPLADHLLAVADRAKQFASAFDSSSAGYLAGLWHDVGKVRPEFQAMLRGEQISVEHAGLGAALAAQSVEAQVLAFAIAGHHAGLANASAQGPDGTRKPLKERINVNRPLVEQLGPEIESLVGKTQAGLGLLPDWMQPRAALGRVETARRLAFWIRMVFSALVDADRLETERFYRQAVGGRERDRDVPFTTIGELCGRLQRHIDKVRLDAKAHGPGSPVNQLRDRVLAECLARAIEPPGCFSLTVPTGGGKTLSGMAFALEHARGQGLRRVVVAVPYTTVIEQNAAVYAAALGVENVIEHHSSIDEPNREEQYGELEVRRRLATENWDAPIIVTTNVQLFESLFSGKPSQCRKLHRLARSVIILDEAQTLPPAYLQPILEALKELIAHYGCTVVLSTATQPALERRESLPHGLENVREIVSDPHELSQALSRVRVHWLQPDSGPTAYGQVAAQIAAHRQVLAITHKRADARRLAELVAQAAPSDPGPIHLSTNMCAAHRRAALEEVRRRLHLDEPCRVVSTQLVEAGVDLDFPVVYRALAGLDSLAQSAGRCNRNGLRRDVAGNPQPGDFFVYEAETVPPPGILRIGLETARCLIELGGAFDEFADPAQFTRYFRLLFSKLNLDAKGVLTQLAELNFETAEQLFTLIDERGQTPIVAPYPCDAYYNQREAIRRTAAYRRAPSRETLRALQPYLVQVQDFDLQTLVQAGALEPALDEGCGLFVVSHAYAHVYDPWLGLTIEDDPRPDGSTLIV